MTRQLKAQEKSSFCEQKEAKKLCHFVHINSRPNGAPPHSDKSFLLLFFKKADFLHSDTQVSNDQFV